MGSENACIIIISVGGRYDAMLFSMEISMVSINRCVLLHVNLS